MWCASTENIASLRCPERSPYFSSYLLRSTDLFRRDLKTFLFYSVYGHRDTDWLCDMRPRSSSRGRNTIELQLQLQLQNVWTLGRPPTNKRRHWLAWGGFSLRMRRGYHVVQEVLRHWLTRGARGPQLCNHGKNVGVMAPIYGKPRHWYVNRSFMKLSQIRH